MRAAVDAKEFSQALDKASKVLTKSRVPVLGEVMVRFSDGRCVLTGTDLNTWMIAELPARGDEFAFVFHQTANVAKACRRFEGELSFELTETGEGREKHLKLCMSCGYRAGEFNAFFPEDYPNLPELKPECSFTANAVRLQERIDRIKYAALKPGQNTDERSTSIHFSGNRIYCLDGIRAAWDTDETLNVPTSFMVPVAALKHLNLFDSQDVTVQLDERYVDISSGTLHLRFRRVQAPPFDLDSAIPRQFQEEIYVSPKKFLEELAYLRELAPDGKVLVCFHGGRLFTQTDGGRYYTKIQIDGHSEILIGFNLRNLTDALRQFKGESWVRMKLNTPISPVVLEAEGRSDCAMVLPVRLRNNEMAA